MILIAREETYQAAALAKMIFQVMQHGIKKNQSLLSLHDQRDNIRSLADHTDELSGFIFH